MLVLLAVPDLWIWLQYIQHILPLFSCKWKDNLLSSLLCPVLQLPGGVGGNKIDSDCLVGSAGGGDGFGNRSFGRHCRYFLDGVTRLNETMQRAARYPRHMTVCTRRARCTGTTLSIIYAGHSLSTSNTPRYVIYMYMICYTYVGHTLNLFVYVMYTSNPQQSWLYGWSTYSYAIRSSVTGLH